MTAETALQPGVRTLVDMWCAPCGECVSVEGVVDAQRAVRVTPEDWAPHRAQAHPDTP